MVITIYKKFRVVNILNLDAKYIVINVKNIFGVINVMIRWFLKIIN